MLRRILIRLLVGVCLLAVDRCASVGRAEDAAMRRLPSVAENQVPGIDALPPAAAEVLLAGGPLASPSSPDQPAVPGRAPAKADHRDMPARSGDLLAYEAPAAPEPLAFRPILTRIVLATLAVLTACGFSLWASRRWGLAGRPSPVSSEQFQVVDTLQLPQRCTLNLVRLQDRLVLVGLDGGGMKVVVPLVASFDETYADAGLPEEPPSADDSASRLVTGLSHAFGDLSRSPLSGGG